MHQFYAILMLNWFEAKGNTDIYLDFWALSLKNILNKRFPNKATSLIHHKMLNINQINEVILDRDPWIQIEMKLFNKTTIFLLLDLLELKCTLQWCCLHHLCIHTVDIGLFLSLMLQISGCLILQCTWIMGILPEDSDIYLI